MHFPSNSHCVLLRQRVRRSTGRAIHTLLELNFPSSTPHWVGPVLMLRWDECSRARDEIWQMKKGGTEVRRVNVVGDEVGWKRGETLKGSDGGPREEGGRGRVRCFPISGLQFFFFFKATYGMNLFEEKTGQNGAAVTYTEKQNKHTYTLSKNVPFCHSTVLNFLLKCVWFHLSVLPRSVFRSSRGEHTVWLNSSMNWIATRFLQTWVFSLY